LIDTIKSVEQIYKWIIYRLCCESYQNKNEIINTETADQNILDSDVHTDASHYQLGAVISQDARPIAFYSRKLQPAQVRYTTTERELLSFVETLKEF
jgi:hypothetical protein